MPYGEVMLTDIAETIQLKYIYVSHKQNKQTNSGNNQAACLKKNCRVNIRVTVLCIVLSIDDGQRVHVGT